MTHWRNKLSLIQRVFDMERVGLITDMDGTVSPIVSRPEDAKPTDKNVQLLIELQQHLSVVAIVSSRHVEDLYTKFERPELIYYGNSGITTRYNNQIKIDDLALPYVKTIANVEDELLYYLHDGMATENKSVSLTIHYRNADNHVKVETHFPKVLEKICTQYNLKWSKENHYAFEIFPPISKDKGTAVREIISKYQLQSAIYMGDGTSDIDAVSTLHDIRNQTSFIGVGLGVQSDRPTVSLLAISDISAQNVSDVEDFLEYCRTLVS